MPDQARATIRLVIVDDEVLARTILREYLSAIPDVDVVAECSNGFDAVKAVASLQPDLLLLDVQMPKLNGFDVLELVGRDVAVVFVTAYDQYALRAFEVHAVDYLLKPFSAERLATAIQHARDRLARGERLPARSLVAAARQSEGYAARIVVRDGAKVHVLPVVQIDYVQAQDDYVSFHSEQQAFLKDQTLADAEAQLDPTQFVRIHRSFLLNLNRLTRVDVDERDNRIAVLKDGARLPVSRSGFARLGALLK